LSYSGIAAKLEETNIFRDRDPDCGLRADISVFEAPGKKTLLDIQITSPVPANTGTITTKEAELKFRAGNLAYAKKNNKYKLHASTSDFGFLPIIFEVSGQMHPLTTRFLSDALERAAKARQIPFRCLWHYWISSLMITLQRNLAEGISRRCMDIYGRKFSNYFENSKETVLNFDYVKVGGKGRQEAAQQ